MVEIEQEVEERIENNALSLRKVFHFPLSFDVLCQQVYKGCTV